MVPRVESRCSGFDPDERAEAALGPASACRCRSSAHPLRGREFALAVAEETDGAFDPTVGQRMEARGFNANYRTGQIVVRQSAVRMTAPAIATCDSIRIDGRSRSRRPLMLDLGAVAKGLAVDLAARELQPFADFAIDAGGDLYLGGLQCRRRTVVGRHPPSAPRRRS